MTPVAAPPFSRAKHALTWENGGMGSGVWAVWDYDAGVYLIAVYATEVEALRHMNGMGYGHVGFLEFGQDPSDLGARKAVPNA